MCTQKYLYREFSTVHINKCHVQETLKVLVYKTKNVKQATQGEICCDTCISTQVSWSTHVSLLVLWMYDTVSVSSYIDTAVFWRCCKSQQCGTTLQIGSLSVSLLTGWHSGKVGKICFIRKTAFCYLNCVEFPPERWQPNDFLKQTEIWYVNWYNKYKNLLRRWSWAINHFKIQYFASIFSTTLLIRFWFKRAWYINLVQKVFQINQSNL